MKEFIPKRTNTKSDGPFLNLMHTKLNTTTGSHVELVKSNQPAPAYIEQSKCTTLLKLYVFYSYTRGTKVPRVPAPRPAPRPLPSLRSGRG